MQYVSNINDTFVPFLKGHFTHPEEICPENAFKYNHANHDGSNKEIMTTDKIAVEDSVKKSLDAEMKGN